jgi:ATP-dependent Clp protease ATP-binding subunit ClpB
VRRKPYSVVLLDEVEKAHPEVFNILLQVLDDGRLTDSQGRVIDFKNVIIILTSNIGSSIIMEADDVEAADVQEKIEAVMLQKFRPEFLNRVDARICFKKLSFEDVKKIAEIQLSALVKRMATQNIALTFTQKVKDFICEAGYDPAFGARPLRRAIQNHLVDPLASKLLEMSEVTQITVDLDDANKIVLS